MQHKGMDDMGPSLGGPPAQGHQAHRVSAGLDQGPRALYGGASGPRGPTTRHPPGQYVASGVSFSPLKVNTVVGAFFRLPLSS